MKRRLELIASRQGGLFTYRQLLDCGYGEKVIRRNVRAGLWHRVRRGMYVARDLYVALDAVGRHSLRARAVTMAIGERVALSHVSAAIVHGLPVWGLDLSDVHVTRSDVGASRTEAGVHHHVGALRRTEVISVDSVPVVSPARAVAETACLGSFESAVVTADAALRSGAADRAELLEAFVSVRGWPGTRRLGRVPTFASGLAESVGESRLRVLFDEVGLPAPAEQVEIRDLRGLLVGRVDFLFTEPRTVVEFDGRMKYTADQPNVLYLEKVREDRLRELGYEVVRIVWSDLDRPDQVRATVCAAFDRSAARSRWTR